MSAAHAKHVRHNRREAHGLSDLETSTESPSAPRVPVWVALALIAGGLVLIIVGLLLGYVEYTSPTAQIERQGRALLEQELNGMVTEEGYALKAEPSVEGGVSATAAMQPATWLGIVALVAGVFVLPYAIRHRNDVAPVSALAVEPASPPVAPEASSAPESTSKKLIVWIVVLAVAGTAFTSMRIADAWSSRPENIKATALPVGTYEGLSPFETPTAIDADSRFVFEVEIPGESGPLSDYGYATPTGSTEYLVNGKPVTAAEFGKSLEAMPPMNADVVVQAPGKLQRIDIRVPVETP